MRRSIAIAVYLLAGAIFLGTTPAWALTVEQEAKLLASDGAAGDEFGAGVALGGDTAIIGAWRDVHTGSAYVFSRTGGVWTEQAKLLPSEAPEWDGFGIDIALDGSDVAVAFAHLTPTAGVVATDISPAALQVARRNAAQHGVAERIEFLEGDLLGPLREFRRTVDMVASNPPYVSEEEFESLPLLLLPVLSPLIVVPRVMPKHPG